MGVERSGAVSAPWVGRRRAVLCSCCIPRSQMGRVSVGTWSILHPASSILLGAALQCGVSSLNQEDPKTRSACSITEVSQVTAGNALVPPRSSAVPWQPPGRVCFSLPIRTTSLGKCWSLPTKSVHFQQIAQVGTKQCL